MFITDCYIQNMTTTTPFGAAVRHYRKKKGLNQTKLARELSVSQAMITKLETGVSEGKPETRRTLLSFFGKTYSEMIKKGKDLLHLDDLDQYQPPPKSNNIIEFKTTIEKEHFEVIKTFDDPKTALDFNVFLSKLEKLDVAKYEDFYGKVRGAVREIEKQLLEVAKEATLGEAKPNMNEDTG